MSSMHSQSISRMIFILWRERVARFVSSKDHFGDIFTKLLSLPLFGECKCNLNMRSIAEIEGLIECVSCILGSRPLYI
jgi:hypothetical protein